MVNRISWIDWAKAIGITLVVYAHIPDAMLKNEVFLFHMPLWFIISGFLFKPRSLKDESLRCLKNLLLPYLAYNGMLLIITPPHQLSIYKSIEYVFLGNQEMLPGHYRAMWFIVSLIIMRLISSALPKRMIIISVIALPLALVLIKVGVFTEQKDVLQLCTTMVCYHYFVFGYYLKKKSWLAIFLKMQPVLSRLIIVLGILLLMILGHYYVGGVNLFRGNMGQNVLFMLLVSYGISYLLLGGFSLTFKNGNRYIELLSDGTLLILCVHQTLIIILSLLGISGEGGFVLPLLATLLIVTGSIPIIMLSHRYFPILIGKTKSNKK